MNSRQRLAARQCEPCRAGAPTLSQEQIATYLGQVPEWRVITRDDVSQLERTFKFRNFAQALEFTVRVGALAESQGHHPALLTEWGRVTVTWWTHKIGGLHDNDFIMAARTGELYAPD
jgi:4a-hydroxytetrahydrobiopterin dehydratase